MLALFAVIGVGLLLVSLLVVPPARSAPPVPFTLFLFGDGVEELAPESHVVYGRQIIGRVVSLEPTDSGLVARLQLVPDYARRLPGDTQFRIGSLNRWLPDNLGVIVEAPGLVQKGGFQKGDRVEAAASFLPRSFPLRFYLLVAAVLIAAIVVLRIAQALQSLAFVIGGLSVIASFLTYLLGSMHPN